MTDDIVDDQNESLEIKTQKLKNWKEEFQNSLIKKSDNFLLAELKEVIDLYKIPIQPFLDLIDGVEMDLIKNRYGNFGELEKYCYGVASTVGLMTIPIFGYKNKDTEQFAINLGIALQLTNIIRDVKIDALNNRIYIPQDEIIKYDYSEKELINSVYNENFYELMKHQTDRAKFFYSKADKLLINKDKHSMYTARAMEYIYKRLLDNVVNEKYNVFGHKIIVSNFNKIFISLAVFLKYKTIYKWLNA